MSTPSHDPHCWLQQIWSIMSFSSKIFIYLFAITDNISPSVTNVLSPTASLSLTAGGFKKVPDDLHVTMSHTTPSINTIKSEDNFQAICTILSVM